MFQKDPSGAGAGQKFRWEMSERPCTPGEAAASRARGEKKALVRGDGWDVVGEGSVEGLTEVSSWAMGWRV